MSINCDKILILFDIDNTLIENGNIIQLLTISLALKNKSIISILSRLSKKYTLGIWSQGFINIQTLKLKGSKIYDFFDKNQIWISHQKTNLLNQIVKQNFSKIIVIDDKDFSQIKNKYPKIEFVDSKKILILEQLIQLK